MQGICFWLSGHRHSTATCDEKGDCCHDDECTKKRIKCVAVGLLLTVSSVIFLVWIFLRPSKPEFILQDATLDGLNMTEPEPNLLSTNLQVTISTRNPNTRIVICYDQLHVYMSYHHQVVTLATDLPPTFLGHNDVAVWSPFVHGNFVPVSSEVATCLTQDLHAGLVLVNIQVAGCLKWKFGFWKSGNYKVNVNCPALITFANQNNNGIHVGPGIKYQFVKGCNVEVC